MAKKKQNQNKLFFILIVIGVGLGNLALFGLGLLLFTPRKQTPSQQILDTLPSPSPTAAIILQTPPSRKTLDNDYHIFQTFNNCGPASLSMALSYFDINVSQQALGEELRPYQHPTGDNDDKSTTLEEIARQAETYGLLAYYRPAGDIETLKLFLSYDLPVITRTWLKVNDDIGHYRVVKGYDENTQQLLQDDSLQGKNLWYDYDEFEAIWGKFNNEYVVLVPKDKQAIAETILGENVDVQNTWQNAVEMSQTALAENPSDVVARFNLSVALYHVGEYEQSVAEFEEVESQLPFRTLWYQIEPILAYYELGDFDRVFQITDQILNSNNRAFSELYLIRGRIYQQQGNTNQARAEFEKAVQYNRNLREAQEAIQNVE